MGLLETDLLLYQRVTIPTKLSNYKLNTLRKKVINTTYYLKAFIHTILTPFNIEILQL
jgi:hypothetical protein